MELFQEFFMTALLGLVFACVIAKLVSVALHGDDDKAADKVKVVEKQGNLDKRGLRVKGTKSKKRVKFADDVVVKHVHQFEVEERKDFDVETKSVVNDYDVCDKGSESTGSLVECMERMIAEEKSETAEILTMVDQVDDQGVNDDDVCDKGSERTGILVESVEGVIVEEKSEKVEILMRVDQVDDQGVNEDGKVMLCSDEVVGVCGDGVEKVSKNMGLLDEAMEREVVEGKSEDTKTDESFSVKEENVVIRGIDRLVVEEKIKNEEVGARSGLEGLVVEGKMENEEVRAKSGVELENDDIAISLKEGSEVLGLGEDQGGLSKGDEDEGRVTNEGIIDDDWEGIERTELEKRFGEAVNYVECGVKGKDDQLVNIANDVQMQLYGLHKIAVEGPCHEPQPMALNFSARAKWNAWQKLRSMNPEVAMEEYIKLLSENVPGWVPHYSAEDVKQGSSESRMPDGPDSKSSFQDIQPNIISERELELNYVTKGDDPTAGGKSD